MKKLVTTLFLIFATTVAISQTSFTTKNELSKIFYDFASSNDLNTLARIYKEDCSKPIKISNGFSIGCKIYNNGNILILDNIDFNDFTNISLVNGMARGTVDSIKIDSEFPNIIRIPGEIEKYIVHTECHTLNSASGGDKWYKIKLPSDSPIFVKYMWSGGSGGNWGWLLLSRAKEPFQVENWVTC